MTASLPLGLLAELTYRCPLRCPYCSNPVNLSYYREEMTTAEWARVLREGRELGIVQLHLSGGEPLGRSDLVEIVAEGHALGYYINLITSGVSLEAGRAEALRDAGLDHVQLSFQDAEECNSDAMAGIPSFQRKLGVACLMKSLGLPLTINVVLHRRNIDRVEQIIALAEGLCADRLELASAQYYGWALLNQAGLLPTRAQLARAEACVDAAIARLRGRMRVVYVLPDYHGRYPKACMGGWGRLQMTVAPNGDVLPCPAAGQIPHLGVENVRDRSLSAIWAHSPAFERFRGDRWMAEPCRSCPRKTLDFGGCRCQAFQLTGNAAATDPVCHLSPHHAIVERRLAQVEQAGSEASVRSRDPRAYRR